MAKLNEKQVARVLELRAKGESFAAIGAKLGCTDVTAWRAAIREGKHTVVKRSAKAKLESKKERKNRIERERRAAKKVTAPVTESVQA